VDGIHYKLAVIRHFRAERFKSEKVNSSEGDHGGQEQDGGDRAAPAMAAGRLLYSQQIYGFSI